MACSATSDPARASICFGLPTANDVALPDQSRFSDVLHEYYPEIEAIAQEKALKLRQTATNAHHDDFWEIICSGLANIFDAQVAFVSTRVTHDRATGWALPPIGEPGSYLNGLGLYFNDPSKQVLSFDRRVPITAVSTRLFWYSSWQQTM